MQTTGWFGVDVGLKLLVQIFGSNESGGLFSGS
jgi:hypothetical protein